MRGGMLESVCTALSPTSKDRREKTLDIAISADSPEGLLVKYLNELIFHFDTYNFIGRRIDVISFSDGSIRATVHGGGIRSWVT